MTKLESIYRSILFNKVKETELDFKRVVRASIIRHKITKLPYNEQLINALIDKIWIQFLNDIKSSKVGIMLAIHNAFNKYN
jgi:hypothetical protein